MKPRVTLHLIAAPRGARVRPTGRMRGCFSLSLFLPSRGDDFSLRPNKSLVSPTASPSLIPSSSNTSTARWCVNFPSVTATTPIDIEDASHAVSRHDDVRGVGGEGRIAWGLSIRGKIHRKTSRLFLPFQTLASCASARHPLRCFVAQRGRVPPRWRADDRARSRAALDLVMTTYLSEWDFLGRRRRWGVLPATCSRGICRLVAIFLSVSAVSRGNLLQEENLKGVDFHFFSREGARKSAGVATIYRHPASSVGIRSDGQGIHAWKGERCGVAYARAHSVPPTSV